MYLDYQSKHTKIFEFKSRPVKDHLKVLSKKISFEVQLLNIIDDLSEKLNLIIELEEVSLLMLFNY